MKQKGTKKTVIIITNCLKCVCVLCSPLELIHWAAVCVCVLLSPGLLSLPQAVGEAVQVFDQQADCQHMLLRWAEGLLQGAHCHTELLLQGYCLPHPLSPSGPSCTWLLGIGFCHRITRRKLDRISMHVAITGASHDPLAIRIRLLSLHIQK